MFEPNSLNVGGRQQVSSCLDTPMFTSKVQKIQKRGNAVRIDILTKYNQTYWWIKRTQALGYPVHSWSKSCNRNVKGKNDTQTSAQYKYTNKSNFFLLDHFNIPGRHSQWYIIHNIQLWTPCFNTSSYDMTNSLRSFQQGSENSFVNSRKVFQVIDNPHHNVKMVLNGWTISGTYYSHLLQHSKR